MIEIPKSIERVISIIRENTDKPLVGDAYSLGGDFIRINKDGEVYCPLGLLPEVTIPLPSMTFHFPRNYNLTSNELIAFVDWFDNFKFDQAEEVFNAIWGSQ